MFFDVHSGEGGVEAAHFVGNVDEASALPVLVVCGTVEADVVVPAVDTHLCVCVCVREREREKEKEKEIQRRIVCVRVCERENTRQR